MPIDYVFTEQEKYLGLIIEIKKSNNWWEKSCLVLNFIADNGHLSQYYFFCDISPEVREFKFKMIPGQLVTFKVKVNTTGFYRYTAHSLTLFEDSTDFIEKLAKCDENKVLGNFSLFFSVNSLRQKVEQQIKSLNLNSDFFEKSKEKEILHAIVENSKVIVQTWGRNKPGDDDSWGAYLRSDFGNLNNHLKRYLNSKFGVEKQLFSDRGFCSYQNELDKYLESNQYSEDQKEAKVESELLKSRILSSYSFEEHKSDYLSELKSYRNNEIHKIYISLNFNWDFFYGFVKFANYYVIYHKNVVAILNEYKDSQL